jgi:hypothetical protein
MKGARSSENPTRCTARLLENERLEGDAHEVRLKFASLPSEIPSAGILPLR